jgi:hypothetical protein
MIVLCRQHRESTMRTVAIAILLALASCQTTGGRYTGNEFYYTQAGVFWSCRNVGETGKDGTIRPGGAYPGGNCRTEMDWKRK